MSDGYQIMTVVYVREGSRILLGMKKVRLGAGRWNGFGGKVEMGESIEAAARREVAEEAGLTVGAMREVGVCEFTSLIRSPIRMHVFETYEFEGTPTESDEMRPQWFELDNVPVGDMWKSDLLWWPEYIAGRKFDARFVFDKDDNVLEHEIKHVEA
ncbi:MAG: 8-oxo-dGTP diphosphatase [Patescibacteria group bacterium]